MNYKFLTRGIFLVAIFLLSTGKEYAFADNQRYEIPISVEGSKVVVMVQIGASEPVPVLLDTGAGGLRIRKEFLKPSDYSLTGERSTVSYVSNTGLSGAVAEGKLKIGNLAVPGTIQFQLIDKIICPPDKPDCRGAGGRYAGTIGMATFKHGKKVRKERVNINPLFQNESLVYILHVPKDEGDSGAIIVNPTQKERNRFVKLKLTDDDKQHIPTCIGGYCFGAVLDTGSPHNNINYIKPRDLKASGLKIDGDTVAEGTKIKVEFGGPEGFIQVFEAGNGASRFRVSNKGKQTALFGINAFRHLDVLYNFHANVIGLATKE